MVDLCTSLLPPYYARTYQFHHDSVVIRVERVYHVFVLYSSVSPSQQNHYGIGKLHYGTILFRNLPKRLLTGMRPHMSSQVGSLREAFITVPTSVRPFSRMCPKVCLQGAGPGVGLAADTTQVGLLFVIFGASA